MKLKDTEHQGGNSNLRTYEIPEEVTKTLHKKENASN